jgi:hypothetical protein
LAVAPTALVRDHIGAVREAFCDDVKALIEKYLADVPMKFLVYEPIEAARKEEA